MAKRPTYPPEFRRRITDLARAGRSVNSLSEEFTVSRQSIVNWLKQDDLDSGRRDDGLTTDEHKELTLLRRGEQTIEARSGDLVKSRGEFNGSRQHATDDK